MPSAPKLILLFMTALWACFGEAQWFEGGRPVQDREWRKSHKEFGVMLVLSSQPEEFLEAWDKPAAPDYAPQLTSADRVARGQPIVAFVFFTGCRANDAGHCVSTTEFQVLRPDGSEYASLDRSELWTDKEPPVSRAVQLGIAYIGVVIEPDDPLGEYTVKAKVCDQVAGRCLTLLQRFTAAEDASDGPETPQPAE